MLHQYLSTDGAVTVSADMAAALEAVDPAVRRVAVDRYTQLVAGRLAEQFASATAYTGTTALDWSLDLSDESWLLPEWIAHDSITVLLAPSQSGKTFMTIDWICHLALGLGWRGIPAPPARTLVYLSEGATAYVRRIHAWCKYHDHDIADIQANVSLKFGASLVNPAFQAVLAADVAAFSPDLVVFDTFSGTSGLQNENDAAPIATMLTETKAAIGSASLLLVHHPNKASQGGGGQHLDARGSGVLKNNVDNVLVMVPDKVPNNIGADSWTLTNQSSKGGKVKDGEPRSAAGFHLRPIELGTTPKGEVVSSVVMCSNDLRVLTPQDHAALSHLTDQPTSLDDFGKLIGRSRSTAERWLKATPYAMPHPTSGWVLASPDEFDELED